MTVCNTVFYNHTVVTLTCRLAELHGYSTTVTELSRMHATFTEILRRQNAHTVIEDQILTS